MKARRPKHRLSCGRKTGFPTRDAAQEVLASVVEGTGSSPVVWEVYRCRSCDLFHWGRTPKHVRRRG